MLRPTVSRPVSLGMKHPSGAYDKIFITVGQLRVCWCGALSLTRERVCRLQFLLAPPAQSFSGPSPVGVATIFYTLRLDTSFLSPSTTRRATVEVFDPASARDRSLRISLRVLSRPGADRRENTMSYSSFVLLRIRCHGNSMLRE
jgi:hypothetical protein